MKRKIKILTLSSLYPNSAMPRHGIFVEARLRHLVNNGNVEARVLAPVPWFPSTNARFGKYSDFARVPRSDQRYGIDIRYPRFPLIPKFGMTISPLLMAVALRPAIKRIIDEGFDFDVLDAHYFFPDGVAAALLANWFRKPLTVTARGTDINLIPKYALPRKMIVWAAREATSAITVCEALKDELVALEVDEDKIQALRNGVDLTLFSPPENRNVLRKKLGITGKSVISVGHFIERKGHHLVIEALLELEDVTLYLAGDGEEFDNLRKQVQRLGVEDRVVFTGSMSQEELAQFYGAVDMLVLASSREGWANVLLEAMACGTPVVATDVWGTPEVVSAPESGVLVHRTVESIANGISTLYEHYPDRRKTRLYAEGFSWDNTIDGLERLFAKVAYAATPAQA